ncbi:hypothetical protein AKJ57_06580 [candidate division MSBL1 archaeon SCGC-AAA259A05]|uniref:Uncharacterized protein n=1 Tax=candidate division MSBL1 archaeon SCGC-AAA259A05 TaxID=1698259 RepID=A0A133U364_9EURY|nr:hypothetical protein AKJ57_06580 [candidate division MSBL1 archaeon SCGC-AAA259A05]
MGELESPEKVVFGGRKNLRKRERGEITDREWKGLRNNQLYSRGDRSKNGNLNLRLVEHDGGVFADKCWRLRVDSRSSVSS